MIDMGLSRKRCLSTEEELQKEKAKLLKKH